MCHLREGPTDMFVLKLALVTCAVYIGLTLLLLVAGLVIVYWKGILGYDYSFRAWAVLFGIIWFVSFVISWRIVIQPMLARINS